MSHLIFILIIRPLIFGLVFVCPGWGLAGTATVDLATEEGAMNHRANGYLVSIEPTQPSMHLILPLRPTSFRGSVMHILDNYDRLQAAGITEFQLTLGYPFDDLKMQVFNINRIGLNGDYVPWLAYVDRIIDEVGKRQLSVLWDIYNEPDLADLPIEENKALKEGWLLAYQRIKQRIPGAIIVGPSVSRYRMLRSFLEWSQTHEIFPDVVAYHEYGDPSGAIAYVEDLRHYLKTRGLERPISVNEILGQDSWTIAGYTAGVIASYEKADIQSAMRACWPDPQDTSRGNVENTCDNATLDGLLYIDRNAKRPGWHIYKTYADMQGVRVAATTDSSKLFALAALDKVSGTLRMLMGKYGDYSTEETKVVLKNTYLLPSLEGRSSVHVCAEHIPDVGSGSLASPILVVDSDMRSESGELSFTLPQFRHSDAYRLIVGPFTQCQHGK